MMKAFYANCAPPVVCPRRAHVSWHHIVENRRSPEATPLLAASSDCFELFPFPRVKSDA